MNFTWDIIIILLIFGFLFGLISIMAGTGGGVFYVSFMTIFLLVVIDISIDTSNFIILLTSASGFLIYLRDKRTNLKISLIYSTFSIIGCLISTILLLIIHIDNSVLRFLFATTLLIVGGNMAYKSIRTWINKNSKKESELLVLDDIFLKKFNYKTNLRTAIPLFILAGFISNLLGVGGGVIAAPALNLILNFPIHYATGISTSIVFFSAIFNSVSKIVFGQIDFQIGILIGIGSVVGGAIGAKFSKKIKTFYLQLILATILMLFSIAMYL